MSFGKPTAWRLVSPLAVLLWVLVSVCFAGTALADTSTDPADQANAASATGGQDQSNTASEVAASHRAQPSTGRSTSGTDRGGTSGDETSPQPISNADANTGGANGQCPDGPYCSTRDGSASANGSGDGNATGEPCAGCVGKADNKNPSGQKPDASDANAGYECDTNHGIAQTNPAHTGCLPPPEEQCVPTPDVPCVPSPPGCVPTPQVPCVSPPEGGPPAPPQTVPPQRLPNTGAPADVIWLAAAAFASIVSVTSLLVRRRLMTG
jgi:LPXTG-motif cell wall-anchored protein